MIPLPIAAGIFTLLVIVIGIMCAKLERKTKTVQRLEKLLVDSTRELASLEILKSSFLNRIGDVLSTPLKTIDYSSKKIANLYTDLPSEVLHDLSNLSDELHSLIRILGVFEDFSTSDNNDVAKTDTSLLSVSMDEIVSEASMTISEPAANKMVSLAVAICGSVIIHGRESQLTEAVSSILREALKNADPGTVMGINLTTEENMELQVSWSSMKSETKNKENLLGAGFIRLVASSHGGWLNVDMNNRSVTLILPLAGDNQ